VPLSIAAAQEPPGAGPMPQSAAPRVESGRTFTPSRSEVPTVMVKRLLA
jgi:hypothetical protein